MVKKLDISYCIAAAEVNNIFNAIKVNDSNNLEANI